MPTITIELSENRMLQLGALAADAKVSPEELLQASLDKWLADQAIDFAAAANYILEKNAELYQRLAR